MTSQVSVKPTPSAKDAEALLQSMATTLFSFTLSRYTLSYAYYSPPVVKYLLYLRMGHRFIYQFSSCISKIRYDFLFKVKRST